MTIIETAAVPAGGLATARVQRTVERFRGLLPQQAHPVEQVDRVLRILPSHGWPAGWIGRRDRALVVLSQLAGLSFGQIEALSAGDLSISGGVATIRTTGGSTTLQQVDDDLLCGPCALARWVHALDLTVVYPDGRVIAALIARAVPVTAGSPHLCQSNNSITEPTRRVALLPPVDKWGHPADIAVDPRPVGRPAVTHTRGQVTAHAEGPPAVPAQGPAATVDSTVTSRQRALEQRVGELFDPADTPGGKASDPTDQGPALR